MTTTPSPIDFREEILNCLIEHSARVSTTASAGDARRSLEEAFRESKGDYRNPDYRSLLEAMKRLSRSAKWEPARTCGPFPTISWL